jgi:alpha-L-rhamnosidase
LRDEIYNISLHTLIQCMHEHYEDCPWREQSFYTGDSRNQMLCGYYACGEYELPRASLLLISQCIREDDDMLPICFPTNARLVIPSAAFCYIQELTEYYEHSGDKETVEFCFDSAKRTINAFVNRIDETGLVPNFDEKKDFWNFYEWQPYMDGHTYTGPENYDMVLNASLSRSISFFAQLCEVVGEDSQPYLKIKQKLNDAIVKTFYDEKARLFRISVGPNIDIKPFSVMANTYGYLCGAAEYVYSERILEMIKNNGIDDPDIEVIPTTFYVSFDRYEALIKADKELYKEHILADIDRLCFKMIKEGATTFWETEKGQKDFGFAGSLCHGWGAMPIYYYHLFGVGKEIEDV